MQICSYRLFSINNNPINTSQIKSDMRYNAFLQADNTSDVFENKCALTFTSKVPKPEILNGNKQRILDLDSFYKNVDESILKLKEIINHKVTKKELLRKSSEKEYPVEIALKNGNDEAASIIINTFIDEPDSLQKMLVPGLLNKAIELKSQETTKSIMKTIRKYPNELARIVILTPDSKGRLPIEEALDLGNDKLASSMINLVKEQSVISIFAERGILNKALSKECKNTVDIIIDVTTKSPSIYYDMYITKLPDEKEIPFNNLLVQSKNNAHKVFDSFNNYTDWQNELINIACADCKNAAAAVKLLELIGEKKAENINRYIPILFNKNNNFIQREFSNTFSELSGNKKKLLIDVFDKFLNDESISKFIRTETFNHFPLKTTRLRLLADSLGDKN